MLSQRLYYALKPVLPLSMRRGIRSVFAQRKRKKVQDIWPINPFAGRVPKDWPGWPGGKKFAVVLTHDVEGVSGVEKHWQLAELEMKHGFRSSFNFIPEGDYSITREQRENLQKSGFEVGIHDLHHDGKLFNSRRKFAQHAEQINRYAKEWGASGFRAGFMLRNLDWYHGLDIAYDASTFDTDPFEPQPDGVGTIFPFWRPRPIGDEPGAEDAAHFKSGNDGYVELPYTLPQDSSLYLVLGETSPDLWIKKAEWIIERGGMILLNVHPDYLQFSGAAEKWRTFPADYYGQFLSFLREKYGDSFWQPLPREMAEFVTKMKSPPRYRKPKRICMVSHSFYLGDNRIRRYAETLAERGDEVDVFSLGLKTDPLREEMVRGVRMVRIQDRDPLRREQSAFAYLRPLIRFLFVAARRVTREHKKRPYDCVHIHNIPDFVVFSAWYPKFTGTPIILDIHDIVPEFILSKFHRKPEGMMYRVAILMERMSASFANYVIIANDLWKEKYSIRTNSVARCSAFINNVDTSIFYARPRKRTTTHPIMIFPGGLQWHQGVDIAVRAFRKVVDQIPNAEFHIYGGGIAKDPLTKLVAELGLEKNVLFCGGVTLTEVPVILAEADLGVVPKRADSFGNEAYSTKIMEFMSVGLPAVISSTKVDRFYFNDDVVRFFESGNDDELAKAILEVLGSAEIRKRMIANALEYVSKNDWNSRRADYLHIVDSLCHSKEVPATKA